MRTEFLRGTPADSIAAWIAKTWPEERQDSLRTLPNQVDASTSGAYLLSLLFFHHGYDHFVIIQLVQIQYPIHKQIHSEVEGVCSW